MNPNQIPSKPLIASINAKVESAQPIYFFEREDGSVIFAQGREAWSLYSRKPQIIGYETRRPKLIGRSDGAIFRDAIEQSRIIFAEKGLEAAQIHIREAEKAELEKARLNKVAPPNFDRVDSRGNPINV